MEAAEPRSRSACDVPVYFEGIHAEEVVMSKILVTGGSGFVASHLILKLLEGGHQVRATLRSLTRVDQLRSTLAAAGASGLDRLDFTVADLLQDDGWAEAAAGCDFVHHVASPYLSTKPSDENELILPAREGTLRVLRAARNAGVKRVVLTSSFAAIGYGHPDRPTPLTEADWTNLEGPDIQAYEKSKVFAERAAWDFAAAEGVGMELSVVNPTAIFGPVLSDDFAPSIRVIQQMLQGKIPAVPKLYFGVVDVRDLADLHILAMTHKAAAGQRFLGVAGYSISLMETGKILREGMGPLGLKTPKREMPNLVTRALALFNPQLRLNAPSLGLKREASGLKARRMLGWSPRSNQEAILATAESLVRLRLV
jgi:nucleoside-diphosphate-sugar epimerase